MHDPLCVVSCVVCAGLDVLDDDSGKLGEIMELFADITLPLKVEKLIKVSLLSSRLTCSSASH